MALRQHRLPRFWLGLTLGLVAAGLGAAYWWERQLPVRLEQAAARGDLDACLRYSEQLQALRWLGDRSPAEQGECRRRKAAQLWEQRRWRDALLQQLQLVNSAAGQPTDRRQLEAWQESLRVQAMERFQAGQLEESLTLLAPMGEDHRSDGSGLGDQLRQVWERNRLSFERARRLRQEQRWWEALEALNRIDHPWWKRKGEPLRAEVQSGIAGLSREERQHDSHGALPHTVPVADLDREVQRRIQQGMDEWSAFKSGCAALGGRVVEAGPTTACQR
ncbi:MAG: hypothetical protein KFB97_04250 [Cyanobium sp. M30B3]|nr:MAG: hypothetical protein KFB97_04250 [Cyanobium sp. M30B3]